MDFEALKNRIEQLYDDLHVAQKEYYLLWKEYILFSWRWWVAVSMIALPWTLWILVRKKDITSRLLYAGLAVIIVSSFLDMIGIALDLWAYPTTVFPLMPSYIPFDFCILPVVTMLLIQFFPKIKPVVKAVIYAVAGSLLFQPFMEHIGLYYHEHWEDYYSIPTMFGIYMMADYLAMRKGFEKIR